jgi:hypothetical protein
MRVSYECDIPFAARKKTAVRPRSPRLDRYSTVRHLGAVVNDRNIYARCETRLISIKRRLSAETLMAVTNILNQSREFDLSFIREPYSTLELVSIAFGNHVHVFLVSLYAKRARCSIDEHTQKLCRTAAIISPMPPDLCEAFSIMRRGALWRVSPPRVSHKPR